jgi:perosamine synthetase
LLTSPHLAERGTYLFDDCAIALGGSIEGRAIGTLADASVFSFSSFKLLNYFWGGLVTTHDARMAERLRDETAAWPRLGPRDYVRPAKACLKYDLASRPALFSALVFPLIRRRLRKHDGNGGLEHHRVESTHLDPTLTSRPSFSAFAEWCAKLATVDAALAHRRKIARVYRQQLGRHMVSPNTTDSGLEGACFVNFPVLVPPQRCGDVMQRMMQSGYDVGRSLYPNVHRHPKFASVEGNSAHVDRLVVGTIYLPTHFGVSPEYAEEISERLRAELE